MATKRRPKHDGPGRPPKKPKSSKSAPSPEPAPAPSTKLTLKLRSRKTSSTPSSGDITISDESSGTNDDDLSLVQAATQGLLGLAAGNSRKSREQEDEDSEANDDDSSDDEEEDEDEEDDFRIPAITLKFIVPVGAASDTTKLSSTTSYDDCMQKIADTMDIRKSKLQIAYKLSSWKKADKPRILNTEQHLQELFSAARAEIIARSNKKSRKTDAIEITIVDNTPKETKETVAKTTTKKGKKKQVTSVGTDDEQDCDEKAKTAAEWLVDLEEARYCEKHSAHCVVASNGDHIKLSFQGVHTSLSQAPKVLGLPTEAGYEAPAPSRAKLSQPQNAPPQAYPPYPPYPPYPYAYYPPPPHHPHPPPAHLPEQPPRQPSPRKAVPPVVIDETVLDDPTLYPKIDDWLLDLDTSPRGEDGQNFRQYAAAFREHGILRVIQLAEEGEAMGSKLLLNTIEGMKIGPARSLMQKTLLTQDCSACQESWRLFRGENMARATRVARAGTSPTR
ncbi:hypothetical protein R3P38DRAFT_2772451 [Favolaschia claudopus]|uniref:Uncharacterized protein n=1 Tax=Favolaschia claudopus TaxID=2862362 RepID=A0AAW0C607_9AGAR